MVEEQIQPVIFTVHFKGILAADEREADAKLDQELADVFDQPALKIAFPRLVRQRQKVELQPSTL